MNASTIANQVYTVGASNTSLNVSIFSVTSCTGAVAVVTAYILPSYSSLPSFINLYNGIMSWYSTSLADTNSYSISVSGTIQNG